MFRGAAQVEVHAATEKEFRNIWLPVGTMSCLQQMRMLHNSLAALAAMHIAWPASSVTHADCPVGLAGLPWYEAGGKLCGTSASGSMQL